MRHPPTKCRAIIHTRDGQRYLTRWFPWKPFDELDADEPSPMMRATRAAEALARKRSLDVMRIDAQFFYAKEHTR